jgi:hypothetical protein
MPFVLSKKPQTFRRKVTVDTPNDTGTYDRSEFMATFRRVDSEELDALKNDPQVECLEKVFVGWSDLVDDNNEQVPYDPVNRAALLAVPQARLAIFLEFWNSIFKAREGN